MGMTIDEYREWLKNNQPEKFRIMFDDNECDAEELVLPEEGIGDATCRVLGGIHADENGNISFLVDINRMLIEEKERICIGFSCPYCKGDLYFDIHDRLQHCHKCNKAFEFQIDIEKNMFKISEFGVVEKSFELSLEDMKKQGAMLYEYKDGKIIMEE